MCEEHSMAGKGPIIETIMEETLELLTEEQKRKVAVMRIEKIIKILEMKISYMEKDVYKRQIFISRQFLAPQSLIEERNNINYNTKKKLK